MALVGKPEPQRGPARRGVQGVALPLVATVAESFERVCGEQVQRLGGDAGAGDPGPPVDVADLDAPMHRRDAHERLPALGPSGGAIEDGEEQRVRRLRGVGQPDTERFGRYGWQLRHVAEPGGHIRRGRGGVQIVAMARRIERFEPRVESHQHDALGHPRRPGVGDPRTNWKPGLGIEFPRDLAVVNPLNRAVLRSVHVSSLILPAIRQGCGPQPRKRPALSPQQTRVSPTDA